MEPVAVVLLVAVFTLSCGNRKSDESAAPSDRGSKTGLLVINPQFDLAESFSDGLAAVRIGDGKTGKWGFIDKDGKFVINPQFDAADDFHEGLAAVRIGDDKSGKWGAIDKHGNFVVNPQFQALDRFSEGVAASQNEGKWGFIDKQGRPLIAPQFDDVQAFRYGLAAVHIGDSSPRLGGIPIRGGWVMVHDAGKWVL